MKIMELSSVKSASNISRYVFQGLNLENFVEEHPSLRPAHSAYLAMFLAAANFGRYAVIT